MGLAKHINEQSEAAGSLMFCSPNSHDDKYVQTKSDDLYSIVYMMVYLCNRKLPFLKVPKRQIKEEKINHQNFIVII